MKIRGIILVATLLLIMLIVATSSQHYVFADSSPLTTISLDSEARAASSTNITGTAENMTQQTGSEYYHPRGNASLPLPQVIFPTEQEIENYFLDKNVTAPTFIGNSSIGNVTNIQEASSNGITYVVFETELNGTDRVFLTMIGDPETTRGASYSNSAVLTPPHHGNISNLQIAADANSTLVVWQDYNSTTGLNSIFVSSSMESGQMFRTFRASGNDTDAIDPSILGNGVIVWKQECPSPEPGPRLQPGLEAEAGPRSEGEVVPEIPQRGGPLCPVYYVGW